MPGVIGVRDLRGLRTEVIGVSSERAPATALSFEQRRIVTTATADTMIDGVATREPDPTAMEVIWTGAGRFVQISDEDAAVNQPRCAGASAAPGPRGPVGIPT